MKPQQIVFPEDKLIRAYYNRHPTAKFLPIDLQSPQPHFVRNFAMRQLKVMRRLRVSEQEALRIVEAEAREEDKQAKRAKKEGRKFTRFLTPTHELEKDHIKKIQAEEELAWRATLDEQRQAMIEKLQERLAMERDAGYGYVRDEVAKDDDDEDGGVYEGGDRGGGEGVTATNKTEAAATEGDAAAEGATK